MSSPAIGIGAEVLGGVSGVALGLLERLLHGQVSVFLLGARGSGKTSFGHALRNLPAEAIYNVIGSTGHQTRREIYRPVDSQSINVPLIYHDYGGDVEYRGKRVATLVEVRPLGLLFFMDHRDTRKDEMARLPPDCTIADRRAWYYRNRKELGQIDPHRIEEHRAAFSEMIQILQTQPDLGQYCRRVVLIVNKSDLWEEYHRIGEFYDLLRDEVGQLLALPRISVSPFMPLSTVYRHGVSEIMYVLLKDLGREIEIPLFGWRFRIGRSFVGR